MNRLSIALVAAALACAACTDAASESAASQSPVSPSAPATGSDSQPGRQERVDPRSDGLEITLGEWAVTPEADVIRPGRVTFVIRNQGTMAHGFEIELEGESSGRGSGALLKRESTLLRPRGATRLTATLSPGVYKIECLVDGHDDMGMEGFLEVRRGAPLVRSQPARSPGRISIVDFGFAPEKAAAEVGVPVRWRNDDPTEHTVTALNGEFDSASLGPDESYSFTFDEPGTYAYRCEIHPEMKGSIQVE